MAVKAELNDALLQELADKAALRELGMLYARAIDRRDFDLMLRLYTKDGTDDHGVFFSGTAPEFAEAAPENLAGFEVTAHYLINSHYEVEGDRAEGEIYFLAYHRESTLPATELIVGGRYIDHYVRTEEGWKIKDRRLIWDLAFDTESSPETVAKLRGIGFNGSGSEDQSYEWLPLFRSRIHRRD